MRWLTDAGPNVPDDIRAALIAGLYGERTIFYCGVVNTVLVSAAIAVRAPTTPFIIWLVIEAVICVARFTVFGVARRRAAAGRETPTDLHILLGLCWSMAVGYGIVVSMASGDWIVATVCCVSAAAMVGGICFRYFGAPRLVPTMILLSLAPVCLGAALSGEPLLIIVFIQFPMYFYAMSVAAFRLNRMLIATMRSERENDHRARHDALTGLLNRAGLDNAFEAQRRGADERIGLLYLDLDGFKVVNDSHGHAVGDRLLKMVAERLSGVMRSGDIAARIGGDEFVVIIRGIGETNAHETGCRMVRAIAASYALEGGVFVTIGASGGIAVAPDHGQDIATLLAAADAALYEAKSDGKLCCRLASPQANLARARRMFADAAVSSPERVVEEAA